MNSLPTTFLGTIWKILLGLALIFAVSACQDDEPGAFPQPDLTEQPCNLNGFLFKCGTKVEVHTLDGAIFEVTNPELASEFEDGRTCISFGMVVETSDPRAYKTQNEPMSGTARLTCLQVYFHEHCLRCGTP